MPNSVSGMGFLIALIASSESVHAADGFKAIAKELAQAANTARIERVAILPFTPADGSNPKDGRMISEKLITQMVRAGKVQAVERSLLRDLMEEHHLARTGVLDQDTLKKIGKVFPVEAIVTGSFVTLGGRAVVNARLVHVETGAIIAAVERPVDREWFASGFPTSFHDGSVFNVPIPELFVQAPPLPSDLPGLRDAPKDNSCEGASERVDHLEGQILDLKARYWAIQLKKGASLASIKVNPGSTISDPALKKEFYDRMQYWYEFDRIPELTPSEVQRFVSIDGQAYSLYRECGV